MKMSWLGFIMMLILRSPLAESQTLIDSYPESNQDASNAAYAGSYYLYGQSFTNSNAITLHSCKFFLKKVGSPTGSVTCYLFAHTGTYGSSSKPTGAALATSSALDISAFSTSYAIKEFTFTGANAITLTASTYYVIVVEFNGGDASNRLDIGYDNSTPTHGGNNSRSNGTWQALSRDLCFYVYGTAAATNSPNYQIMY